MDALPESTHIWVPVAEYRPDSRSIVYRVDPATLEATEVLRFADHIGGIVRPVLVEVVRMLARSVRMAGL
jgi:hypothetical protein